MEVAAEPSAFLLAGRYQPLPGALELLGQQHRMQGHRHRGSQEFQDPPVGRSKRLLARPQPNQ